LLPTTDGDAAQQVRAAKQAIRERVWSLLENSGAAVPPGPWGRIPDFRGAAAAADRLADLVEWRNAHVVKANPDRAQLPVRARALKDGKIVYMAVPRLAGDHPFVMLDPERLPAPVEQAADKDRGLELGEPVQVNHMDRVDLAVAGSVAVNRSGARVGKGGGFSDIELGLLADAGIIGPHTTVAATVHQLQVLDKPLPETEHDFRLGLIVTPDEVIRVADPRPSPGILWDALDPGKVAAIPVLAARQPRLHARGA